MPRFITIQGANDETHYLNVELIRAIYDQPAEDGVRVDFDAEHRIYLDRGRAAPLLKLLERNPKSA